MADDTTAIASHVAALTRMLKRIQARTAVKTSSKPLAKVFKIELSDLRKRLVTIPTAALLITIATTCNQQKRITPSPLT